MTVPDKHFKTATLSDCIGPTASSLCHETAELTEGNDGACLENLSYSLRGAFLKSKQLRTLQVVVNRKGSLSAFDQNFLFQFVPKHFSRISLSAERALTAEMLNFGRNTAISAEKLLLFRQKETTFS